MSPRRTQEERRRETIGKLVDATIAALAELGYASTSVSKICKRAGVSQGGLYNHFGTRLELIVRATDEICRRHLGRLEQAAEAAGDLEGDLARGLVEFMRQAARTDAHAAWHEVMVAARTDDELREAVRPALAAFEQGLFDAVEDVFKVDDDRLGPIVLSLMHIFDSEAVTATVYPNEQIEQARIEWAAGVLRAAL